MNKLQIGKMPQLPFEVSEAINQLSIYLSFCGSDVKTIMITSSTPNEGKSFVTMQLWRMIAELGTPAVLIDCDFRKSEMRSKYGMSTSGQLIGGVHYLAGKAELDDVIYEEFKGTGNMELVLDRKLQEKRVFPAIDIPKSGTRREDLLLSSEEQEAVYTMRKALNGMKPDEAVDNILNMFARTKNNEEFVQMVKKTKFL